MQVGKHCAAPSAHPLLPNEREVFVASPGADLGSVARLSLESERKERDAEAYQRENSPDPWQ
jgi:hypothetical protein